jgi:hypothetical protein
MRFAEQIGAPGRPEQQRPAGEDRDRVPGAIAST